MSLDISTQSAARYYKHWAYKNTTILIFSLLIFIYLIDIGVIRTIIEFVGELGYLGALITGIFFVSTFTVIPAVYVMYNLSSILTPFEIAFLAGMGALLGDYILFRFFRDRVFEELKPLFLNHGGSKLLKFLKTPYFAWLLPVLGAIIIASPLPDEAGVSILGLSKIKNWQFLLMSYLLNTVGIFILITLTRA
jgi:hypothetical protein